MTEDQMRRVAHLLAVLDKIAEEDSVLLRTIAPYIEVDGTEVGQLQYNRQINSYQLIPIAN